MWYQAHTDPKLTENLVMRHNILVNNDAFLNQKISEKLNDQINMKHGPKKENTTKSKKDDKAEIDNDDGKTDEDNDIEMED